MRSSDIATIFLAIISERNDIAETLSVMYTDEVITTDAGYHACASCMVMLLSLLLLGLRRLNLRHGEYQDL